MLTNERPKRASQNAPLSIVSATFGSASYKSGPEDAPHALLSAGVDTVLISTGRRVNVCASPSTTDYSHLQPSSDLKHLTINRPRWVSAVTKSISDEVFACATQGHQVLTLGGDHSIAIGTLTGITRALRHQFGNDVVPGIVYVDAHADINTPQDSTSGNLHGMGLAWASGLADSKETGIFDWIDEEGLTRLEKLVYIGLRDVDDTEKRTIEKKSIKAFWAEDVKGRVNGIKDVMDETLQYLGSETPLYVSFDIDGLDPGIAPSTGLPVANGLSLEDGVYIMSTVKDTGRLVGMDLVEINPRIGSDADVKTTVATGIEIIRAGLGA